MASEWKLNREDFLSTLEQLTPGLLPKGDIEQSECFAFNGKRILTYNDEIACWHKSPIKLVGAVPSKPLLALLRQLSDETITVSVKDEHLLIGGKRPTSGIRFESEITLPVDQVEQPEEWVSLKDEFCEAIRLVESCAATDAERDGFDKTCVHIHPKRIEATNNLQAIRYKIKTRVKEPVLVRSSSIKHIVNMGMVEFSESDNWIHFRNPQKMVLSCRRFTDSFPALDKILESEGHPVKLSSRMGAAAAGANIFTADNVEDDQIMVTIRPGKMKIEGRGPFGWFRHPINIKYDGKPLEFMIVPTMFQEIVKQHRSCLISDRRLRVDGPNWTFVACLNKPSKDGEEGGEDDGEESNEEE